MTYVELIFHKPIPPPILNQKLIKSINHKIQKRGKSHSVSNILGEKLNGASEFLLSTTEKVTTPHDRCSCGCLINTLGRKLVKICIKLNLKDVNGETTWDSLGNYMCFNNLLQ